MSYRESERYTRPPADLVARLVREACWHFGRADLTEGLVRDALYGGASIWTIDRWIVNRARELGFVNVPD